MAVLSSSTMLVLAGFLAMQMPTPQALDSSGGTATNSAMPMPADTDSTMGHVSLLQVQKTLSNDDERWPEESGLIQAQGESKIRRNRHGLGKCWPQCFNFPSTPSGWHKNGEYLLGDEGIKKICRWRVCGSCHQCKKFFDNPNCRPYCTRGVEKGKDHQSNMCMTVRCNQCKECKEQKWLVNRPSKSDCQNPDEALKKRMAITNVRANYVKFAEKACEGKNTCETCRYMDCVGRGLAGMPVKPHLACETREGVCMRNEGCKMMCRTGWSYELQHMGSYHLPSLPTSFKPPFAKKPTVRMGTCKGNKRCGPACGYDNAMGECGPGSPPWLDPAPLSVCYIESKMRSNATSIPSCSYLPHKQWTPLDYGTEERTTEGSAEACAERCNKAPGCIGSSFWIDGGCHLATTGATLKGAVGAESYKCSAAPPVSGPEKKEIIKEELKESTKKESKKNQKSIPSCSYLPNKQWAPLDYGTEARTTEGSAKACAERCNKAPGCIGSSFWTDGGCHLATTGAILGGADGVESYECSAVSTTDTATTTNTKAPPTTAAPPAAPPSARRRRRRRRGVRRRRRTA